jgi:hypothetical protein
MTALLPWFRKKRSKSRLLKNQRGSLTLEAMLTLPVLLFLLLLCVALINTVRCALILEGALGAACREIGESSYLLRQAVGLGIDLLKDEGQMAELPATGVLSELPAAGALGELAETGMGHLWAAHCLNKYLGENTELKEAIEWRQARVPVFADEESGWTAAAEEGGDGGGLGAKSDYDEDDVVLTIVFTPARLKGIAALLPDAWQIIFTKRQRAWLTGRNLLPDRGLEQAAGKKEQGTLVYITRWGIKYHVESCRYLAKSKIPAYLERLAAAYGPCQVCKPPGRLRASSE